MLQKRILLYSINKLKSDQMKNLIFKPMIVIFIFFTFTPAHAYIDPGMGSLILQGLIGAIAAVSFFFTNIKNKIFNFFKKKKKTKSFNEYFKISKCLKLLNH